MGRGEIITTSCYLPLTDDTWDSFVEVMSVCQGGDSGCWCTWWQLTRSKFEELGKEGRKQYLKELVKNGKHISIIAFENQIPFRWCAVAPVTDYPVILRSRIVKPTLNDSCWYISCFFIKAGFRRKGAMSLLINYAIDYAKKTGQP